VIDGEHSSPFFMKHTIIQIIPVTSNDDTTLVIVQDGKIVYIPPLGWALVQVEADDPANSTNIVAALIAGVQGEVFLADEVDGFLGYDSRPHNTNYSYWESVRDEYLAQKKAAV
jgi:hypothetical protein